MDPDWLGEVEVHCTVCASTNLKIEAHVTGEGEGRRVQRSLVCLDCGNVLAYL